MEHSRFTVILPIKYYSERCPLKNHTIIDGWPIYYYALRQILETKLANHVVFCADRESLKIIDPKIYCLLHSINVPFSIIERDKNSYQQGVSLTKGLSILMEKIQKLKLKQEYILIYPTSINFTDKMLELAVQLYDAYKRKNIVFCAKQFNLDWDTARSYYRQGSSGFKPMNEWFMGQDTNRPAQGFIDAGQFYIFNLETYDKTKKLLNSNSVPFQVNNAYDINTQEDLISAIRYLKVLNPGIFERTNESGLKVINSSDLDSI